MRWGCLVEVSTESGEFFQTREAVLLKCIPMPIHSVPEDERFGSLRPRYSVPTKLVKNFEFGTDPAPLRRGNKLPRYGFGHPQPRSDRDGVNCGDDLQRASTCDRIGLWKDERTASIAGTAVTGASIGWGSADSRSGRYEEAIQPKREGARRRTVCWRSEVRRSAIGGWCAVSSSPLLHSAHSTTPV